MLAMKVCIGIISYLPTNGKEVRRKVFEEEIKSLNIALNLPILVIAQNYTEEDKKIFTDNCIVDYYGPLGVTKARQVLRHKFLETDFDYMILFDDDEVIKNTDLAKVYLQTIYDNPNGYIHYFITYLRACAVSRYVMERIPFIPMDAQKLEGWDDAVYVDCVKKVCPECFVWVPGNNDLECDIGESNTKYPSTWQQYLSPVSAQLVERNSIVKRQRISADQFFTIPDYWYDWKDGIHTADHIYSVVSNSCLGVNYYHLLHSEYKSPFIGDVIEPEEFIKLLDNLDTMDMSNISQHKTGIINTIRIDNKVDVHYIHLFDNKIQERYLRRLERFNKNDILVLVRLYSADEIYGPEPLSLHLLPKHIDKVVDICNKKNYKLMVFDSTEDYYMQKYEQSDKLKYIKVSDKLHLDDILPIYQKEIQL